MDAIVQLPHAAQSHLTCGCSDQHNRSALLNVIALGTCLLSLCTAHPVDDPPIVDHMSLLPDHRIQC